MLAISIFCEAASALTLFERPSRTAAAAAPALHALTKGFKVFERFDRTLFMLGSVSRHFLLLNADNSVQQPGGAMCMTSPGASGRHWLNSEEAS